MQLVGGAATLYMDDGTNELGSMKLAADGVWSSDLRRRGADNGAITLRGGGVGLTINGFVKYSIVDLGA